MFELIEIDTVTGEEEFVITGTMRVLEEHRDYMIDQADEDGYDCPWIIIRRAS